MPHEAEQRETLQQALYSVGSGRITLSSESYGFKALAWEGSKAMSIGHAKGGLEEDPILSSHGHTSMCPRPTHRSKLIQA